MFGFLKPQEVVPVAFREGLLSFRTPKKFSPGKTIKVRLALYSAGQLETPTVTVALAEVTPVEEEGGYLCTGLVRESDKKVAILNLILARGGIPGADRRRTKRLTASVRILSRKLENFRAVTANLNETGVELVSDGAVTDGTYLNLQFDLESAGSELTVQAVVIWSAKNPETEKFRVGVAFTEQHPETHATWSEFYRQLLSTEGASVMLRTMGGSSVAGSSGAGMNEDLPPLPPPPPSQPSAAPAPPAANQQTGPQSFSSGGFTPPPPPSGYQAGPNKQFNIPQASPANPLGGGFHSQQASGPGPAPQRLQLGGQPPGRHPSGEDQGRSLQLPQQGGPGGYPGQQPGGFPQPPGGSPFQLPGSQSGGAFNPGGGGGFNPGGGGGFNPGGGGGFNPGGGGGFNPGGGGGFNPGGGGGFNPGGGGGFNPGGGGGFNPGGGGGFNPGGGGGFNPGGGGGFNPGGGGGFNPGGGGGFNPGGSGGFNPGGGGGFNPGGGGGFNPGGGGGFNPGGGGGFTPGGGGGFNPGGGGGFNPGGGGGFNPGGGGGFNPGGGGGGGGFQVPVPPTSTPGTFQPPTPPPAPSPPPAPAGPEQVQPSAMSGNHIQFRTRQQQRYQMGSKTQVKLVLNVNGNPTAVVVNIQVAKVDAMQDQTFAVWGLLLEEERKVAALRPLIRQV